MILKKTVACLLAPVLIILCSCSREVKYTDKLSTEELSATIRATDLGEDEYAEYDREYFEYFFSSDTVPEDFKIIYSTETNDINELGIFHAKDTEELNELSALTSDYIKNMQNEQRAFIASYAPNELPKLDEAEIMVFGNYVIYAILDSEHRASVFLTAEKLLRE